MSVQAKSYQEFKDWRANSLDVDEPPHQDLRCLQIGIFSSLVVEEFTKTNILALYCFFFCISMSTHILCKICFVTMSFPGVCFTSVCTGQVVT